jgi:diaminohydroxyphosphoribosylaminopyrimidine deaminase/5-amino-6-(5-phosphoribosylamino)uracil reductase
VTVKRAFDPKMSMIPPTGQKTFTSRESLKLAHLLRKKADAILTGSGTVLADSPLFDVRHVPDFEGKRRILAILDRRNRVSQDYLKQAERRGFDVLVCKELDSCLSRLANREIRDVLVESGPILSDSILNSELWTMKVDIFAGETDRVALAFRDPESIPFDIKGLEAEALLPL